jgi:N-acetylglucosaminyl-diphospho-decaprenol L-rhamnosyltransferase
MTYGVVIVTYQTKATTLARCLHSLSVNGLSNIVVVDNSSDPLIRQTTQTAHTKYLPQPTNHGFAAGANIGARHLADDYILFLNPDTVLEPNAFTSINNYLKQNNDVGIIGLMLTDHKDQAEKLSFGHTVTPISLITRHFQPHRMPSSPTAVGWVSGGALLIQRQLFNQLEGFDQRFFLYWEDVDLCRRAKQRGRQVILLPQAKVSHQRGASLANLKHKTKFYDESADKYFCKHYPKMICLNLRWLRHLYRLLSPLVD